MCARAARTRDGNDDDNDDGRDYDDRRVTAVGHCEDNVLLMRTSLAGLIASLLG